MFKKNLLTLFIALTFSNAVFATEINNQIENWNSAEGIKRLERSQFKNDFYQLANFYQPQINPLYCSAATGTMILNALNYGNIPSNKDFEIHRPESAGGGVSEFHLHSQQTFFNEKTNLVKKREIIDLKEQNAQKKYDAGLSLLDFSKILAQAYHLKTKLIYAEKNDEKSVTKFRETLKKNLAENKHFIVVNFDGKILGQKTGGHISPITAYDEESDSVLILDVALHKNQWFWAPVSQLFVAMNSKDDNTYRGYLVISR